VDPRVNELHLHRFVGVPVKHDIVRLRGTVDALDLFNLSGAVGGELQHGCTVTTRGAPIKLRLFSLRHHSVYLRR